MVPKNDFQSVHGPSDALGLVVIRRLDVFDRAQRDRDMFPMDYGAIETDWTGRIELRAMNRDAIAVAIDAMDTWGRDAWASLPEAHSWLTIADAKLAVREGAA